MPAKSSEEILAELRDLFTRRTDEVRRFLAFLTALSDRRVNSLAQTDNGVALTVFAEGMVDRDLVKTLRANGYLLLYNLVESTMTNAIDAIHQSIRVEQLGFDDLRDELKRIVLKRFDRVVGGGMNGVLSSSHPIQKAMVELGYDKRDLFSGNVDGRVIKKTAERYGFEVADHDHVASGAGRRLLQIKTRRNDLAHGHVSFEDCGHETSQDELEAIANETVVYLGAVIEGVEAYIVEKAFSKA